MRAFFTELGMVTIMAFWLWLVLNLCFVGTSRLQRWLRNL